MTAPALTPGKLWGLRRMADAAGRFKMVAVDQRPPIKNPIKQHLGVEEAPWDQVAGVKRLLVETLQGQATALLLDPHYAIPAALDALSPTKGFIATLEDSVFTETPRGRLSAEIDNWSVEKIKRFGADAVKVLVWHRPDADAAAVQAQQDFAKRAGEACARYDIPYLLELLAYPLPGDADQTRDYVEMGGKNPDHVLASVAEFAKPDYGVDVFKLESPVAASAVDDSAQTQALFDEMGRLAGRPWVMLSAGADKAAFKTVLACAYRAGASGFLAGRAIWMDAFRLYPDWAAMRGALETDAVAYMQDINALTDAEAASWLTHGRYGEGGARLRPADAGLRAAYSGL